MTTKNYLLFVFLAFVGTFNASAKKISETEAAAEATKFCQMLIGGGNYHPVNSLSRVAFSSRPANPTNEDYYIFNIPDGGFVIIAGDDRVNKVLGYSDKGRIDTQNLPPQLEGLLKQYSQTVQSLPENAPQHKSWTRGVEFGDEVVLNTPTWNQGYPFNVKAPEFDNGAGQKVRAPIGCAATATAIVMKYKGFPTKAIKDFEHTWYSNGTHYIINYGELNIDYSKLRDDYENLTEPLGAEEEKAIGDLMYAVAGIVNMDFGPSESSAYICYAPAVLREFFGFSTNCQYIGRSYFSDEKWRSLIEEQIDNDCPVIYEGYYGGTGHMFVCDGYNSEGYYHINWGWGGYENGFFMLDDLNGYNQYHSMIINFTQDHPYDSSIYSRAWLSDGTQGGIVTGAGKAAGIQVTTNDVETGIPFSFVAAQFNRPFDFEGVIAVALVDANDNIIEFAKDNHKDEVSAFIRLENYESQYPYQGYPISFRDIHFTSPIKDDYKLALYTKETGEENWKRLLGTIDAPSSIPVKGNVFELPEVKVTVHGDASKVKFDREIDTNLMYGDWWQVKYKVDNGVAALYINGRLLANSNDFNEKGWYVYITEESYDMDIYYYPYSELLDKEYNVEVPGSLSTLVDKEDMKKIWKLRLTGELDHEDLYFLLDFPCLMHLDFGDTHIVENEQGRENFIPALVGNGYFMNKIEGWGLETCKLPKNLKGFEGWSLYPSDVESISIPATVDTYEDYAPFYPEYDFSINFIEIQNPVPVELKKGAIGKDLMPSMREKGILFVPVGSKSAYENHPSWQGFKEIIETSEPLIGEFVDDDNVRYLILNDYAAVSGVYGGVDVAEIKSTVEYNGKTYPVKYAVARKLNAPNYLVINNEEAIDFKQNFASNVISPFLNPKFTDFVNACIYVPGASNAKDGNGNEANKMWTYKLNKKIGRLLVESNYDEVTIKTISINGMEFAPNASHVYEFEPTNEVTVSVTFEAFGSNMLTTTYDTAFNASLEDEEIISFSEKKAEVEAAYEVAVKVYEDYMYYYEGDGMKLYQQVIEKQTGNESKAEQLFADLDALVEKVFNSNLPGDTQSSYVTLLNVLRDSVYVLREENNALLWNNNFYNYVQDYLEVMTGYYNSLTDYKSRIDVATTVEELTGLIANMSMDASWTESNFLNPIISEYNGLVEVVEPHATQINDKMEACRADFQTCSDEVNAAIEAETDLVLEKKVEAETAYKSALTIYESYMSYYEGDGMKLYQQVIEKQTGNESKAEQLFADLDALVEKVFNSNLPGDTQSSYVTLLNVLRDSVSVLREENNALLWNNNFYNYVQDYLEVMTGYYNRLTDYKSRIDVATTVEELIGLIANMSMDASWTESNFLNPIISEYNGLVEVVEPHATQINDKLATCEANFQLHAEEIEAIITRINAVNADAEEVLVYTISGMKQKMKRSDLKHLPKGVYIINGKKYMVK